MDNKDYDQEKLIESIRIALDIEYERMYPFDIEQGLSPLFKMAEKNKDKKTKQEILWEIDLINRVLGYKGVYQGKEVMEISNKWKYILDTGNFKPFSNPPFCEWDEKAVEYYKKRYPKTKNNLAKARYAFAIMVFSSGKERLEWMKKSVDNWLKTAETYINDGVYNKKYYEN